MWGRARSQQSAPESREGSHERCGDLRGKGAQAQTVSQRQEAQQESSRNNRQGRKVQGQQSGHRLRIWREEGGRRR